MTTIAERLRAVRDLLMKNQKIINVRATIEECREIQSALAAFPDPDAVGECIEALIHVRDSGCRIARIEDVGDRYGFVAVPHEEAVEAVKAALAKLEEQPDA